jgi:hypothetical protein
MAEKVVMRLVILRLTLVGTLVASHGRAPAVGTTQRLTRSFLHRDVADTYR